MIIWWTAIFRGAGSNEETYNDNIAGLCCRTETGQRAGCFYAPENGGPDLCGPYAGGRLGRAGTDRVCAASDTVYGGIDYAPVYQFSYYIRKYPDIRKAYGYDRAKVLRHFVKYGMKEGRQASASFQVQYYRRRYADLRKAYGSQLMKYYLHYIRHGIKEGRFPTSVAEQKWLRSRRFIMVGDSNAQIGFPGRDNSISWPELVTKALGLSASQVTYCRQGGYGFAAADGKFVDMIRALPSDSRVTDILIVGGAGNDRSRSYAEITKGYAEFVSTARAKFPNAKIMHCIPNWSLRNMSYQKAILANIPLYKRLASSYGCFYISAPETVLHADEAPAEEAAEYIYSIDTAELSGAEEEAVSGPEGGEEIFITEEEIPDTDCPVEECVEYAMEADGEEAGTAGMALRVEAIRIMILPKTDKPPERPGVYSTAYMYSPTIYYRSYVEGEGWQDKVTKGKLSGTSGKALRLEGLQVWTSGEPDLGVEYLSHVQDVGWEKVPASNGGTSGRPGSGKRMEAVRIQLTGNDAGKYDLYYCLHVQNIGWLGWAKNGDPAGSSGVSMRVEGLVIRILPKGSPRPANLGKRTEAFVDGVGAAKLTLSKTTAAVTRNRSIQLTASVLPENRTFKGVTWSSSRPSVASVSGGLVTGKRKGTAVITCTSNDGRVSASCTVTVS